jgi:hypothetical protein
MVIITTETLVNNVSQASLVTELNSIEVEFVEAYGEPQINLGGTFTYVKSSVTYTFVLVSRLAGMRNGIPFVQAFDGNVNVDAPLMMAAWVAAIITTLTAAKTTLLTNPTPNTPNVVSVEV